MFLIKTSMRKRTLLSNNNIIADICFYDKENKEKIIVSSEDFSAEYFPLSQYTPIGIVAIPSEHTDEGRPRIVSLADMNRDTPDSGSVTSHQYIYWGGRGYEVTDLPTKDQFPYLSSLTEDGSVNYRTGACYLPSDAFSGETDNPLNSLEGFDDNYSYKMCSPYKEDSSKEERYFDTSNTGNVLSDFDGKTNTNLILAEDNRNSTEWQTASSINNSDGYNQYVHPSAQCCWRYHTDGTKQGDWYLPSAGELGYAVARQGSINIAINTLNTQYRETLGIQFRTDYYWSSTQYSSYIAVVIDFRNGYVGSYGYKDSDYYTRAFLIV